MKKDEEENAPVGFQEYGEPQQGYWGTGEALEEGEEEDRKRQRTEEEVRGLRRAARARHWVVHDC